MSDLIERNALLETFAEMLDTPDYDVIARYYSESDAQEAIQAFKDIPAANRWIPCSEMFPEDDEPVLISCNSYHVHKAWYDDITHRFNISDSDYWYREDEVLAWMPLPEAYRPSKNEEQEDDNIL